jgi:hypothetical protein
MPIRSARRLRECPPKEQEFKPWLTQKANRGETITEGQMNVELREFRSSIPVISSSSATEIVRAAVRNNEKFYLPTRVENAGNSIAHGKLPRYILEGVISEYNSEEVKGSRETSVLGVLHRHLFQIDSIGIDLRAIDATSGLVVATTNVRKKVEASAHFISTAPNTVQQALNSIPSVVTILAGAAIGKVADLADAEIPLINTAVDSEVESRKESLDHALWECSRLGIEQIAEKIESAKRR